MILKKHLILKIGNNFRKFILLISGIAIIQAVTIYDLEICSNSMKLEGRSCSLVKKLKITYLGNYLLDNYKDLKQFLYQRSLSGMIVDDVNESRKRFKELKSGFNFFYQPGTRKNAGFILLSRGNPESGGEPTVELWDLNNQLLIHKWDFDMNQILSKTIVDTNKADSIYFMNPLLLEDGSLIVNDIRPGGPLIKISLNGTVEKVNVEYKFHHSLNMDNKGNIYVPIAMRNKMPRVDIDLAPLELEDQGFAILDKDLNIKKVYSISKIYEKSGLDYLLYSRHPSHDPFHINDVEPFITENDTNIVLISLRSSSSIIAFDMKSEEIKWMIQGYFNRQHDVDILDNEGRFISIFDNNVIKGVKDEGNRFVTIKNLPSLRDNESKDFYIYSFPSKQFLEDNLIIETEDFDFFDNKDFIPITNTAGQSEMILKNNSVFIEESNHGRSFEYDFKRRKLLWEFINRNNITNNYYRKSWSRRYKNISQNLLKLLNNRNSNY